MSSSGIREIDRLPVVTERAIPMQVLCLGLSRTSTMTMCAALKTLGYKSYHFTEATNNQWAREKHLDCWVEGMEAKLNGKGKPFGRVEFDKLLRNYSAVSDAPCANFYEELVEAYPEAKVVLTTRDPDTWIKSMESSILAILSWRIWKILDTLNMCHEAPKALHDLLQLIVIDWTKGKPEDRAALRAGFLQHNENVRKVVPEENLLEFSVKQGWGPLCEFLDKPVPNEPFPFVNKGGNVANWLAGGMVVLYAMLTWKYAKKPLFGIGLAWMIYRWTQGAPLPGASFF